MYAQVSVGISVQRINPLLGGVPVAIVLKVKRKEKNSQPPNEQNKMAALDIRFHH
jgi:hypothetical protein